MFDKEGRLIKKLRKSLPDEAAENLRTYEQRRLGYLITEERNKAQRRGATKAQAQRSVHAIETYRIRRASR